MSFTRYYTASEFLSVFTPAEYTLFYAQIDGGNVHLRHLLNVVMASTTVLAGDNPLVVGGVSVMVQSGVLSQERADEILGTA